jgi:RNA polymerase sigma factor (sigma-70 family)
MSNVEFEILVKELNESLYRFAYFKVRREDIAQDVVQECMVKLWNENKPLKHYLNVKAYCITLVKNKCIDALRAETTRKNYELQKNQSPFEQNIEDKLEREEKLKLMDYYLNQLNENQATALRLRDFDGYSYSEIAEIMTQTEANVKVLIFRGRNALIKNIKKQDGVQSIAY